MDSSPHRPDTESAGRVRPCRRRLDGPGCICAVLASYCVIRPISDEAGVAGGVNNLLWSWTSTLIAVSVSNPAFAALVARLTRVQFRSRPYRFLR